MTKKHYTAISAIIESTYNNAKLYPTAAQKRCEILETVSSRLADYFATDNKNFDRTRFLQACGIEPQPTIDYHPNASHKDCATNSALKDTSSRHFGGCYACGYTGR